MEEVQPSGSLAPTGSKLLQGARLRGFWWGLAMQQLTGCVAEQACGERASIR